MAAGQHKQFRGFGLGIMRRLRGTPIDESDLVIRECRKLINGGVFFDVGANVGEVSEAMLPLASLASCRRVPRMQPQPTPHEPGRTTWHLLSAPGLKGLLAVNWLFSMCWDVHSFAVPVLGHERGFSASTIGFILGTFTLAVTGIRMVVPALAHRIREGQVLRAALLGTAIVFSLYPLAATPWLMGGCAVLLGMTLGVAQPLIMTTLHQVTPDGRHGEALAFRSMAINASSTVMPLLFGALGSAVGAGVLFWSVGLLVGGGSAVAQRLLPAAEPAGSEPDR